MRLLLLLVLFCCCVLGDAECGACELVVALAGKELNSTSVGSIQSSLEHVCHKLPSTLDKACVKVAHAIAGSVKLPAIVAKQNYSAKIVCSFFGMCKLPCCEESGRKPSQISTSLWLETQQVEVSRVFRWVTEADDRAPSYVQYGATPESLSSTASAKLSTYTTFGWLGTIHNAYVEGLPPSSRVYYRVGSTSGGWSSVYSFTTGPYQVENKDPLVILNVGDMGAGPASDPTLKAMADQHNVDVLLHNGDISYADGNQETWDYYGQKVEPLLSHLPMLVSIGNHEAMIDNGIPFSTRYQMRQTGERYFSLDLGNVHLVALNSENALDIPGMTDEQVAWLTADLEAASQRASVKWIVLSLHRLLYCSSPGRDCTDFSEFLRDKIESLLLKYRVDLVIQAHKHSYEALYPMAYGNATQFNYSSPSAPVYVTNGVGGSREGFSGFLRDKPVWSRVRLKEWGLGLIKVIDDHSLVWELVSDDTETIVDTFTITK